jgi:hypothetical protein
MTFGDKLSTLNQYANLNKSYNLGDIKIMPKALFHLN